MHENVRYSRPLAAAEKLGENAEDSHRFLDKRVLLTGDVSVLLTSNGHDCLIFGLLLIVRICRNVTVFVPPALETLLTECRLVTARIKHDQDIVFAQTPPNIEEFDAVLSVGTRAKHDQQWTVINSNGWLARVSSGDNDISPECSQANPIGALAAASLGAIEVFKRLIRLREERGQYFNGLTFSLYNYQVGGLDPGPVLPITLFSDLLLIGAGAIGNGIVLLLSRLPLRGHVLVVDPQRLEPENLGTYILAEPSDVGLPKVAVAEAVLSQNGISVKGYEDDFNHFRERVGKEIPYPRVVVNGLDNVEARHQVQHLWPDMIIDGAISDFACQVSTHPWGRDVACLLCLFRDEVVQAAEQVASRVTGLSLPRVLCADEVVTVDDVKIAPNEKQEWLRKHVGRKICSVIQEGVAQDISKTNQRTGFQPSAPFVACFSASMVVSELLKYLMGVRSFLEPRYQFDMLRGPKWGLEIPQERRRDCVCVTRAHNIELVRARRFGHHDRDVDSK